MTPILLSTLLTLSAPASTTPTNPAPAPLEQPYVTPQTEEGIACIENLVAEKVDRSNYGEFYGFEGPHTRDPQTVEYWIWNGNVRAPAYAVQLTTEDSAGWTAVSSQEYDGLGYTAFSLQAEAPVYELLRGGDLGYYVTTVDLTPCAQYLR